MCKSIINKSQLKDFHVVGTVDSKVIDCIKQDYWYLLDLSKAIFIKEEPKVSTFVCHGRAFESRSKDSDPLMELLASVHTVRVVLPANISRKQLNVAIKSENIYQIIVTDDCGLFSMKDGNVWNKKGTILVYEQAEPSFVTCADCGKPVVITNAFISAEGKILCKECLKDYRFCLSCWQYFSKDNPDGPLEGKQYCKKCTEERIEMYGEE